MVRPITRREFVIGSAAGLASVGFIGSACGPTGYGPGPYEGIYTDQFTYRVGDFISVYAALHQQSAFTLNIKRWDTPEALIVAQYPAQAGAWQRHADPGVNGAGFSLVASIPASDLGPGIYEADLPPELMLVDDQVNNFNGFPSDNTLCRFVVTDATPGSRSRLLWLHDSLTGVAYGSFGYRSIYGATWADPSLQVTTVSYNRPGLDRGTTNWNPLRFFIQNGYAFEYIDLVALWQEPIGFLDAYDLVVIPGQFEYIPHEVLEHLDSFLAGGGNIFAASEEFAIQRVRLSPSPLQGSLPQLTTYKFLWAITDPLVPQLPAHPELAPYIAGVGMNIPGSFYESQIIGQTMWACNYLPQAGLDLPTFNFSEAGWILDGTGLQPGDPIPGFLGTYGTGNLLAVDDSGTPFPTDLDRTRTPDGTIVWGALPCADARAWWLANNDDWSYWPNVANGYATATLQQRASGAQVVTLPAFAPLLFHLDNPLYQQIFLNILAKLSVRA